MADIEHKDLPDELLHEPKGIYSAMEKTLYFADGLGSGTWRTISGGKDIHLTNRDLEKETLVSKTATVELDSSEITSTANGILEPVSNEYDTATMNAINHNMSEMVRLHNNQKQINENINQNIDKLYDYVDKIYEYLKTNGFLS